jgi:hypothetical protein
MTTRRARELANHLATNQLAAGQSFDNYTDAAPARWPGLTQVENSWAIAHAVERAAPKRAGSCRSLTC